MQSAGASVSLPCRRRNRWTANDFCLADFWRGGFSGPTVLATLERPSPPKPSPGFAPLLPKASPRSWIVGRRRRRPQSHDVADAARAAGARPTVETAEGLGWSGDAIEAQAFLGFLAAAGA